MPSLIQEHYEAAAALRRDLDQTPAEQQRVLTPDEVQAAIRAAVEQHLARHRRTP